MLLITITGISFINAQTTQQCVAQYECEKQDITASQIDCIGTQSCEGASLTSNNRKKGYIECSGFKSCNSYKINKVQYPSILSAAANVYCSGQGSCWRVGAINATNIYCTAASGCSSVDTLGPLIADKNIYCYGTGGCSDGNYEIGKKAFCSAERACSYSKIVGGLFNLIYLYILQSIPPCKKWTAKNDKKI